MPAPPSPTPRILGGTAGLVRPCESPCATGPDKTGPAAHKTVATHKSPPAGPVSEMRLNPHAGVPIIRLSRQGFSPTDAAEHNRRQAITSRRDSREEGRRR